MPNTELGHMEVGGVEAEQLAAAGVRDAKGLSWEEWAVGVNEVLLRLEALFSPDLFIIGGGVSRKAHKFLHLLVPVRTRVVAAETHNDAGIIGAAMAADGEV